jgi:hypothetical protein
MGKSLEKSLKEKKTEALRGKNRTAIKNCCIELGDFFQKHDRFEEAFEEFREYADLCQDDPLELAKALRLQGEAKIFLGEFKEGLFYIRQYLQKVTALRNQVFRKSFIFLTVTRFFTVLCRFTNLTVHRHQLLKRGLKGPHT